MFDLVIKVMLGILNIAKLFLIPIGAVLVVFVLLCSIWFLVFKFHYDMDMPASGQVKQKRSPMIKQLLFDVPRRYMLDMFNREPDYFYPRGIHMFCGEQGCGKTAAAAEMMLRLQKQYPKAKCITNFGLETENDSLTAWQQLLTYSNGHQGVIVGIDEIQNWFMSGTNKLPEQMLEVATQNRKNNRILCCTAQVFTRVNKGLREQVTLVYNPHTFLGCFTVVVIRKPVFDDEGNIIQMKYRGMYAFTHSDELRESYDTYKVIHSLAKEGFKDRVVIPVENNVFISKAK